MERDYVVNSEETLNKLVDEVREAQKKFSTYTQEQVDKIFLKLRWLLTK